MAEHGNHSRGWTPYVALEGPFARHPKLLRFTRSERWTWVELLCYCAEYRTDGVLPPAIRDIVGSATPALLRRFVDAGLLDLVADATAVTFAVHDWDEYNGTGRQRQEARDKKRAQRAAKRVDNNGTEPGTE